MTAESNKILVRRYVEEVFGKGNLDLIGEFVAADTVNRGVGTPDQPDRPTSGLRGPIQVIGQLHSAFPDLAVMVEDVFGEGDKVLVRHRWTGTHRGEILGIAATGRSVTVQAMNVFRIADGKIVERWGGPDLYGLIQQLGDKPPVRH